MKLWEWLVVFLIAALIAFTLTYLIQAARADQQCAELGWRDYKIIWNLKAFCIREENEYEIIRPLKELLNER